MATITQIDSDRGKICNELLRSLPDWFGIEEAIQQYSRDVELMPTFVAKIDNHIVGFLSLNLHNKWTAEIHVMAVNKNYHRKRIGHQLVTAAETYLMNSNYEFLSVKTLADSNPSPEYKRTRMFYSSNGFIPVQEFKTLWGESNPCLLMIKKL